MENVDIEQGQHDAYDVTVDVEDLSDGSEEEKNEGIERMPSHHRITVEFRALNAYVQDLLAKKPSLMQRMMSKRESKEDETPGASFKRQNMKQILFDVSARVRPGEVLALMGPSGSGKTTLLSIAGGRAQKSMKTTGVVTFNGSPLDKAMKRRIGYVMQDDLLHEALTVRETLYYAAMLRLPRDMPRSAKLERIDAVLKTLGLVNCQNTIVGGFFRRGISGGERKRTSVGYELLINPSILFLDEPTSGLDSTTSYSLLGTLRELASSGRTVVTTIHQPSSRLYQKLDKVLLLSQGHVMYYGIASEAVDFFERLGYTIPPRVNAADFILDLSSGEVAGVEGKRHGGASREFIVECSEMFLKCHPLDGFDLERDQSTLDTVRAAVEDQNLDAIEAIKDAQQPVDGSSSEDEAAIRAGFVEGKSHSGLRVLGSGSKIFSLSKGRKTGSVQDRSLARSDTFYTKGDDSRWGASYWGQVGYLFERNLRTRRLQSVSTQDILQFMTIAVLSGLFWLQKGQGDTVVDARDTIGVIFFMLMFLSFRSLFVSLFTFPEEQRHMLKERASGMYRLSAFYVARTLSDFPTDMSIPSVFIVIVYFMAGLRYNVGAFFGTYGTLLLSMFVAQSLGLLLGAIFMNPKTAQAIAAVLMLTIILTAGYFVTDIPSWIGWIKWLSYIFYSLGILLYLQFDGGNKPIYSCVQVSSGDQCSQVNVNNPSTDASCVEVNDLQGSLGLVQDPTSVGAAVRNGMILLAFLIVTRIVVYYVLRNKTSGL